MRARFYYDGHHHAVAMSIKAHLNSIPDFLTPETANSPRAVGDTLESIVAERFDTFLGDWCSEYWSEKAGRRTMPVHRFSSCSISRNDRADSSDFARRAMADLAFTDRDGIYTVVTITNFSDLDEAKAAAADPRLGGSAERRGAEM